MDLEYVTSCFQNVLSSLIRINEFTITLRHQSVKDFLLNRLPSMQDSRRQEPVEHHPALADIFGMSMGGAESTLAECCINFLNLDDFNRKRSDVDETTEMCEDAGLWAISTTPELTPKSPVSISREDHIFHEPRNEFFEYAAATWGFHYSSSESTSVELTTAALTLSARTNTLLNWSHQYRRSYYGYNKLPDSLDPLIVAAYFCHTSVITRLISNNEVSPSLNAGLIQASRMGHLKSVNLFIKRGIPNIREKYEGATAFSWATAGGFLEIVIALLACDQTMVNVTDANGNSPLSLAVSYGHLEVVDRLLGTENIDVNLTNDQGTPSIFYAFERDKFSAVEEEILRRLLKDLRIDITIRNMRGRSILSYAAEQGVTKVIQKLLDCPERQVDIQILLDDVDDNEGLSPLSRATRWGHFDAVRLLCETKQIDRQLWSVDKLNGDNAFHIAARSGQVQIIKELTKHHPDGLNTRDLSERTPLSTAMWENNLEVLRALLDGGADVNLPDFEGKPPVSYGAGKIEMVKVLVEEYGACINMPDSHGHTPLWHAMNVNGDSIVYLKKLGAGL